MKRAAVSCITRQQMFVVKLAWDQPTSRSWSLSKIPNSGSLQKAHQVQADRAHCSASLGQLCKAMESGKQQFVEDLEIRGWPVIRPKLMEISSDPFGGIQNVRMVA